MTALETAIEAQQAAQLDYDLLFDAACGAGTVGECPKLEAAAEALAAAKAAHGQARKAYNASV
jgi:hypothetical protein